MLGAIVVRELQAHGRVTLFLNRDGVVELAPPGEIELDALPEDIAIQMLVAKGYSDELLITYLKAREARSQLPQEGGQHGQDL